MPKNKLVIATHNKGKLKEIAGLLVPYAWGVTSAGELGLAEPEETGLTFAANAILKAEAAMQASGLAALADDSGLAVEALGGAPGIYSARWAGGTKDFALAMKRVEDELQAKGAINPAQRRAAFICVLALSRPNKPTLTFEGRVEGVLVWPPRGDAGFGYDAMFVRDGDTRTFAEMTPEEKHGYGESIEQVGLSHRAKAFQAFARGFPIGEPL
jgi:XTP/dITP diphosphohydrolase